MSYERIAVVMAGGSGERFWPLSRKDRPKQLLQLSSSGATMLGDAIDRLLADFEPHNILVVTSDHLVAKIRNILAQLPPENILAEPEKRNTSGCLIYAAAYLRATRPDARISMTVATADHRIEPIPNFSRDVRLALDIAERDGVIVTIGISPTRPDTGYGYIETWQSAPIDSPGEAFAVKRFHEKPSADLAEVYCQREDFLWNSGMAFWTLDTFDSELRRVAPAQAEIYGQLTDLIANGDEKAAHDAFAELPNISIDYALLERAGSIAVVKASFDWDDLGSWDAVSRYMEADSRGNRITGDTVVVGSADCSVHNVSQGITVALSGVYGLLVAVTDDAVLICDQEKSASIRDIVEQLKRRQSPKL